MLRSLPSSVSTSTENPVNACEVQRPSRHSLKPGNNDSDPAKISISLTFSSDMFSV